jgi:hypothetical protein
MSETSDECQARCSPFAISSRSLPTPEPRVSKCKVPRSPSRAERFQLELATARLDAASVADAVARARARGGASARVTCPCLGGRLQPDNPSLPAHGEEGASPCHAMPRHALTSFENLPAARRARAPLFARRVCASASASVCCAARCGDSRAAWLLRVRLYPLSCWKRWRP